VTPCTYSPGYSLHISSFPIFSPQCPHRARRPDAEEGRTVEERAPRVACCHNSACLVGRQRVVFRLLHLCGVATASPAMPAVSITTT